jgi:hypothetical protein
MNEPEPSASRGWFKAMRSGDVAELIRANPNAFVVAFIIAMRARYSASYNADGLVPGEALMGDYEMYGMTRQQYRTALSLLRKAKFATTRTTSKGTIARLTDTRLFEVSALANHQPHGQTITGGQPTPNQRVTTNKKERMNKNERNSMECVPRFVTGRIEIP